MPLAAREFFILSNKVTTMKLFSFLKKLLRRLKRGEVHYTTGVSLPPPLTLEEEQEAARLLLTDPETARELLITRNLRLVVYIAKKFETTGIPMEDLISIGTIGLIKAVNTFSPEKKIKLATYASRCIENEILMHFRLLKKTANDISFNDPIDTDKDGNALTLMDLFAEDDTIVDDLDLKFKTGQLRQYIREVLSPREEQIILLRYGIGGRSPLPQREVAKRLGISRSYVSRIEKRALEALRKRFEKGG